jgi:hypothetical protein
MSEDHKVLQVNLHHAKASTDAFCRRFATESLAVGLLQEPWSVGGSIRGIPKTLGNLLYSVGEDNPRAAIVLRKDIMYFPLVKFSTRDLVAVGIDMMTEMGPRQIVIASAYLPGDCDLVPTQEATTATKTIFNI